MQEQIELINKLTNEHTLAFAEWKSLLQNPEQEMKEYLLKCAREVTDRVFGRQVYVRGLIEFTNICN